MSLPDAFAVATAKELKAKLLIGADAEFKGLKIDVVRIWNITKWVYGSAQILVGYHGHYNR